MGRFKDPDGREWSLRLTVGDVSDVKRETGVNLALVSKDRAWVDVLFGDPEKLVAMLWVLCEPQAKKYDLTPEAFAHLFDGPTLGAAGRAMAEALAFFFPMSKIGAALKDGMEKILAVWETQAVAEIGRAASTACDSLTSAPASSASTPVG